MPYRCQKEIAFFALKNYQSEEIPGKNFQNQIKRVTFWFGHFDNYGLKLGPCDAICQKRKRNWGRDYRLKKTQTNHFSFFVFLNN